MKRLLLVSLLVIATIGSSLARCSTTNPTLKSIAASAGAIAGAVVKEAGKTVLNGIIAGQCADHGIDAARCADFQFRGGTIMDGGVVPGRESAGDPVEDLKALLMDLGMTAAEADAELAKPRPELAVPVGSP